MFLPRTNVFTKAPISPWKQSHWNSNKFNVTEALHTPKMFALQNHMKNIFFPTSQHVSASPQSAEINRGVKVICSTPSLFIKEGGEEK